MAYGSQKKEDEPEFTDEQLAPLLVSLTEQQKQLYLLRRQKPKARWREIGAAVNLDAGRARSMHYAIRRRLRENYLNGSVNRSMLESAEPLLAAEAMEALAAESQSVAQIARDLGLGEATVAELAKRMHGRWLPLKRALGQTRRQELKELAQYQAWKIASSVDDIDIAGASLRDKAVAFGVFVHNAQLLDGLPTEILSIQELAGVDELFKALNREARRRGYEFEREPALGFERELDEGMAPKLLQAEREPYEAAARPARETIRHPDVFEDLPDEN